MSDSIFTLALLFALPMLGAYIGSRLANRRDARKLTALVRIVREELAATRTPAGQAPEAWAREEMGEER